jgi:hypothetical protein
MEALIDFFVTVPARIALGAGYLLEHPLAAFAVVGGCTVIVASGMLHLSSWRKRGAR